jgi:hypothetical protein
MVSKMSFSTAFYHGCFYLFLFFNTSLVRLRFATQNFGATAFARCVGEKWPAEP